MNIDINMAIDVTKVIVIIITWEIGKIVYDKIKQRMIKKELNKVRFNKK